MVAILAIKIAGVMRAGHSRKSVRVWFVCSGLLYKHGSAVSVDIKVSLYDNTVMNITFHLLQWILLKYSI